MANKRFMRRKEDFVCENCGFFAIGSGYTNHCPKCLWSKHVDINPGDRENKCQGMMEPKRLEINCSGGYDIVHKCLKCGAMKKNKVQQNDSKEELDKLLNN
jgi:hypothetical protein